VEGTVPEPLAVSVRAHNLAIHPLTTYNTQRGTTPGHQQAVEGTVPEPLAGSAQNGRVAQRLRLTLGVQRVWMTRATCCGHGLWHPPGLLGFEG